MSQEPPKYGYQVDETGQIDLLTQLLGPLGSIFSALGMSPDAMALNFLTGNPYAGQLGRLGGRTPSYGDVLGYQNQQAYFDQTNAQTRIAQERVAQRWYEMMGSTEANARIRAQNAMKGGYFHPVGLGTELGMLTYNEKGMHRAMSQGYMAMNIYSPAPGGITYGNVPGTQQDMRNFTAALTKDFLADPGAFGGLDLQGTGQVFQQMSQRSVFGRQDITAERANNTKMEVQKMSKAVAAMQDLFGGTIPELFDKMDAIFGGTASAMGGDQLMDRVMRMKSASQLTGQSLSSLAMMSQTGGFYAQQAGMDFGIGAMAAEQTYIQLGVNYAGALPSVRRVNQGRLRQASLQLNTAGAASRMSQYYAGAFISYLNNKGYDYYTMDKGLRQTLSDEFAAQATGVTNIGGLARIEGVGSVMDIRDLSMSDAALIAMQDDRNVSSFGIRGNVNRIQESMAASLRRAASRRAGVDIEMSVFMNEKTGQLRSTADIIRDLESDRFNLTGAAGIVNNIVRQYGSTMFGGMNSQEVEAYLYQFRNQDQLRKFNDARAAMFNELGSGVGGVRGAMNFLMSEDGAKSEKTVGNVVAAALGLLTPEDMRDKVTTAQLKESGKSISLDIRKKYRDAVRDASKTGDWTTVRQLENVMTKITDPDVIAKLSRDEQESLKGYLEGGLSNEALYNADEILQDEEEGLRRKILEDSGMQKEYYNAMYGKRNKAEANRFAKKASLESAIKGVKNTDLEKKIRDAITAGGGSEKVKTESDLRKVLKSLDDNADWSSEERDSFFANYQKNKEAFSVGDPKLKLDQVLNRLAEAIEALVAERKTDKELRPEGGG
jgi:hypothetical protein